MFEQQAFTEYMNNTVDAWAIDDDLESENEENDIDKEEPFISKQAVQEVAKRVIHEHKTRNESEKVTLEASSVRRPVASSSSSTACPGIGIRLGQHPSSKTMVPVRFTNQVRSTITTIPDIDSQKENKFKQIFEQSHVDLNELRKTSWNGIPKQFRAEAWKLLCGYLPAKVDRRDDTLKRKRDEYWSYVSQYYHTRSESVHQDTFRQIHIDIPRMNPLMPIFQQLVVQELFERILFIWAIRHPASGYVQGINDLVTPFFVVFLSEFIDNDVEIENFDIGSLPEEHLRIIEADSYWCTSSLLDGIQDNYTFAQPGIQYKVRTLEELIKRIDDPLYRHLKTQHIEFLQFAFRWMNNLLMRELPVRCTIRLWDTYHAEQDGFSHFHLYICAAFLVRFSKDLLREKDFQGLLLLLQNLPTHSWTSDDISILTAEAYQLKVMFANAPRHLS
ncbi:unnamed protein product [Didymodactylos carnosus]|uniref:Rab-GAP TBC domain-containing protein n=1 Tax=Didymodactylos carnosus TaxID=1234261 RepID=A0A8S2EW03_9BILA|nr:unnamed protein product [Didymodactylos carnosus]CAF4139071.1 unnamed protein product [Didymodactylos carnosus]